MANHQVRIRSVSFLTKRKTVLSVSTETKEERSLLMMAGTRKRNIQPSICLFEGCLNCPYEYKCRKKIKNRTANTRKAELSLKEEKYKKKARENLLSIRGIEIRVNRSIQAEGSFGELKQNMGYIRFRRRGIRKVSAEIMLMCLGINIRKLFSVYKKEKIESHYWEAKEDTTVQSFPTVKPKKKG